HAFGNLLWRTDPDLRSLHFNADTPAAGAQDTELKGERDYAGFRYTGCARLQHQIFLLLLSTSSSFRMDYHCGPQAITSKAGHQLNITARQRDKLAVNGALAIGLRVRVVDVDALIIKATHHHPVGRFLAVHAIGTDKDDRHSAITESLDQIL